MGQAYDMSKMSRFLPRMHFTLHVFLIIILPPLRATPLKKSTGHRRQTLKIIVEICTDISVISLTFRNCNSDQPLSNVYCYKYSAGIE